MRRRRKCPWCRRWFQPAPTGRPPTYCKAACRQRAYEERRRRNPRKPWLEAIREDLVDVERRRPARGRVRDAVRELAEGDNLTREELEKLVRAEAEIERLEEQFKRPAARRRRAR